ncbi:MAG TPA: sensor histidine kinase [Opitutaceae bacterium]|nr:sensor histidine kinase [Opitutaceae bacterium]
MRPSERTQSLLPFGLAPKKPGPGVSVAVRFGLLAGSMTLVLCTTLLLLRLFERRRVEELLTESRADASRQVGRLIELDSFAQRQLARDFAAGDFTDPLRRGAEERRDERLRELAVAYGLDAVWLLDGAGVVEVAGRRGGTPGELPVLALPTGRAPAGELKHFFAARDGVLWEVTAAPRPAEEGGWFVAARRWDAAHLAALANQLECRVQLVPSDQPVPAPLGDEIAVVRALPDAAGVPVRVLHAARSGENVVQALHTDAAMIRLFVAFGVLMLTGLAFAVHRWVLAPLARIGESLAQESPAPLQDLAAGAEFAAVARLAEDTFARKAELKQEVEERRRAESRLQHAQEELKQSIEIRLRLARNLHDSLIQSIYATGLGLESARGELATDPAAAAARLAHCRANLNETIREVRGFINDLEPESLRRQPFAQALRSLAYTMQSLWVATIAVEIDEPVALRFTPAQETHVLQIVREAISNALRHGEATRIQILLQGDAKGRNALLKVQDNGRGFDAARRTGTGHGLVNMANRAGEMGGSLKLHTEPDAGTTLVLRVPLTAAPA